MFPIQVARVYDLPPERGLESRVLVDRLWPRGVRKESLDLDAWAKNAAPSTGLRKWYGHDPERFEEFAGLYLAELAIEPAATAVAELRAMTRERRLVLLTATRDLERSHATVLRGVMTDGSL
ncbi:MAG: DUF488 family protein [Actinomycetota bacterium]|nr:DUF488 family protein [Actinomycetota bacterium]